jgi:hypothetical protein
LDPPPPQIGGEARFSIFLGYHKQWYGDDKLEMWLRYLDDYGPADLDDLDGLFAKLLLNGNVGRISEAHKKLILGLREGMMRFYRLLGWLFSVATSADRRHWGLMYAYWMAKAFGYELKKTGYVQQGLDVGAIYEKALARRGDEFAELGGTSTDALLEEYRLVLNSWNEVRSFVNDHLRRCFG